MRAQKLPVILGLIFPIAAVALADKVTSDYDHTANFAHYKTFMWIREPEPKEPFLKERIMASVNAQLIARGMCQVDDGADLAIGANVAAEEKYTWQNYYAGSRWGWDSPGWQTTTLITYEVGTIAIQLFDADSRKLIWQAVGTNTASPNPEKRTRESEKEIEKMFRDFPVAAGH